jgi:hypothetical protein
MKQKKHRKKGRIELSRAISSARDGARVCGSLCRGMVLATRSTVSLGIFDLRRNYQRKLAAALSLQTKSPLPFPSAPVREDEGLRDWSRLSVRHAHACVDVCLPCVCPPSLVCTDKIGLMGHLLEAIMKLEVEVGELLNVGERMFV